MMPPEDRGMRLLPRRFPGAFAPLPRSTWVHPDVPNDGFDRVCKTIWRRAREAAEELGRCQSSPEREQATRERVGPDSRAGPRAEEQQKETDDLGLSGQYKEDKPQHHTDFILPCPYLAGRRPPHVAEPARVLSPVMEAEMRRSEGEAKGEGNVRDVEDKQSSVENSPRKICVTQSGSAEEDEQGSAPEPQPAVPHPVRSVTEDHMASRQEEEEEEDPALPPQTQRDACESEGEPNAASSLGGSSSDDDELESLPGVRTCATDSSDSASDNNDCVEETNESPHADELSSDRQQDSPPASIEKDFPPLSTVEAGIPPCPREPPASGKMHGQWDTPLSFHPHDIPSASLASDVAAHAQAPVQGEAEAPKANSKTGEPPAAPTRQEAYDLLADFPALQPPKIPLALGALRCGNPKTQDAEGKRGRAHWPSHRQESGASHQRRMENVPHEVSSICAGDQKSVPDLQTFGSTSQGNSPTVSCEELKANNQPPPRVAGTDGVCVNARSWASAAKAGMKQAAAPQEKARPCTFQQIVTINRAKVGYPAVQSVASKVTPSHHVANPTAVTAVCHGPRSHNPNRSAKAGDSQNHQQFGARTHRANCPPGFRCPRFPFQQAKGHLSKHSHV